ncbi:hypothetical protein D3C87_1798880 [compost metagenome]
MGVWVAFAPGTLILARLLRVSLVICRRSLDNVLAILLVVATTLGPTLFSDDWILSRLGALSIQTSLAFT